MFQSGEQKISQEATSQDFRNVQPSDEMLLGVNNFFFSLNKASRFLREATLLNNKNNSIPMYRLQPNSYLQVVSVPNMLFFHIHCGACRL